MVHFVLVIVILALAIVKAVLFPPEPVDTSAAEPVANSEQMVSIAEIRKACLQLGGTLFDEYVCVIDPRNSHYQDQGH